MADSKITDLTAKTVLDGTEELVANDSTADKKIGIDNLPSGLTQQLVPNALTGSRYYRTSFSASISSAGTMTGDRLYAYLIIIPSRVTVTRLGVNVTASAADSSIRVGLYTVGTDGLPGTLIVDGGQLDASSTGVVEATISEDLYGAVYLAAVRQGTGNPSARVTGIPSTSAYVNNTQYGHSAGTSTAATTALYVASVTGALPSSFGTPSYHTSTFGVPDVMVRVV